jgi:predicted PhzF superfamily epimerase YddE/YHI9
MDKNERTKLMIELIKASGKNRQEIADALGVSLRTIDSWHVPGRAHRNPPQAMLDLLSHKITHDFKGCLLNDNFIQ